MNAPRQVTDGARQLRAHLKAKGQSLRAFCREHEIDYAWVHRQLSGERGKRVSVDFAYVIQKASGGDVQWDAWRHETLSTSDDDTDETDAVDMPAAEAH